MHQISNSTEVCFLTTVFPMPIDFLYDFFDSLDQQSYKSFDLIIVNDGNQDLEMLIKKYNLIHAIVIPAGESPIDNREIMIRFAIKNKYKIAVFGDSDDKFSENRISVAVEKLQSVDIIVNDLNTFTGSKLIQSYYLSNRVINEEHIHINNILEYNILGLSNTAVNISILQGLTFPFDKNVIALDWYLFSILLSQNVLASFTNKSVTYYRQHENNIAGMGIINDDSIKKTILVRIQHYQALSPYIAMANELKNEMITLQKDEIKQNTLLNQIKKKQPFPLWWEL
tara:strand:- start:19399 stop:20250 length:852 start_codon:yes stop_codon:yes gene_type:complete